jgi:hypothetical protein
LLQPPPGQESFTRHPTKTSQIALGLLTAQYLDRWVHLVDPAVLAVAAAPGEVAVAVAGVVSNQLAIRLAIGSYAPTSS